MRSPDERVACPEPPSTPRADLSRLVVIDDDLDVRLALADLLGDSGYEVASFADGRWAFAHLCQSLPPAVVLVDVMMAGMNAWELIGEMKRRERLAAIPVVAMTGLPRHFLSPVAEEMTVRKPIDPARILELIRRSAHPQPQPQPAEGGPA